MSDSSIQAVLFACTHNAVRSPIAAALLHLRSEGKLFVTSCGVRAEPEVDVFAVAVMEEVGIG